MPYNTNTFYKLLIVSLITFTHAGFYGVLNAQSTIYPTKKSLVVGTKYMVTTAHPMATAVGQAILKQGGNAIDAAIAINFALAVCYPTAGNLGGGGFALVKPANKAYTFLDFRETSPAASTPTMFLDTAGKPIPKLSTHGALAAGTPGSVAGMAELYKTYGTIPWKDLIAPAIKLATMGFTLTEKQAAEFNNHNADFTSLNGTNHYLYKAQWKAGDTLKQPVLAKTLVAIATFGTDGFYKGWVADSLVAQMQRSKGIITLPDLATYKPLWREPLKGQYRGYTLYTAPPPSAGGVSLLQMLKMVERFELKNRVHNSAVMANPMVEAMKLAYADRHKYIADPDFVKIPLAELLDDKYLTDRFFSLQCCRANPSTTIQGGVVNGFTESEETTHFSVVDAQGNAVSLTTTLNSPYGSHQFVRGAGFILNNEMDDFSIAPNLPNQFGLPGNTINAIAPGKRMCSSMCPTIVEKDGKVFLVIGTPGGATIPSNMFQTIVNVIDYGWDIQTAIDAPKFHHQWLPDLLYYEENTFSKKQLRFIKELGYTFKPRGPIGRVDAVLIKDGKLYGGADSRGDDKAIGE